MYLNQVFVSKAIALQLKNALMALGCPTENRVLIISPKDQDIIQGGQWSVITYNAFTCAHVRSF